MLLPSLPRGALNRALLLIVTVNLLLLSYYICVDYQFLFHSDSAAANLLAQEMLETGHFFPPAWHYVNGDLWLLYMQVFILPLLKFFPNGYPLHATVSIISAVLVLWGSWLLARVAGLSGGARLAVLAVFSAGISPNMVENLYGQAAYGNMYYSGCFMLYFAWRYLQEPGHRRWAWGGAALAIALTLFWANPQRAAVYYGMPLAVGTLALAWQRRLHPAALNTPAWPRALLLVAGLIVTALAGALLHRYTLLQVNGSAGLSQAQWLGYDGMLQNIAGTVRGLLSLLAGLPPPGGPVMSPVGALYALRLSAALALLLVLPWAMVRSLDWRHAGRLFIASGALCTMAVCLFISVTTTIPVQATPEASIRYVVPALLVMLVLAVGAVMDRRDGARNLRASGLAALAVIMLTAPLAYLVTEAPRYLGPGDKHSMSYKWRLANYLKSQGLRYGYSNFWSAGETTVLSAGAVRARQIEIVDGMPMPMRHLASDRWYQPGAWQGESFLMVNPEEAAVVDWPRLTALTGAPVRQLEFERWKIMVYDHNIAADLAAWDSDVVKPIHYQISERSAHQAGRYNPAAGALEAARGEAGALLFGPGLSMPQGAYSVSFDIEASGAGDTVYGQLDVTSAAGQKQHALLAIETAGRQRVTLPFDLDRRADGVEFRVIGNGAGALKIYGVDLQRRGPARAGN